MSLTSRQMNTKAKPKTQDNWLNATKMLHFKEICGEANVTIHQIKPVFTCSVSAAETTAWLCPLTGPCVSQLQQRAEVSCHCSIIKTSVEVTGSPGGMQHSKAPLLSCFLCELSRPPGIYSNVARRSPLPSSPLRLPDRCHLQASISGAKTQHFQQPNKPHTQTINRTGVGGQHQRCLTSAGG